MIVLTKLDQQKILVNLECLKYVEAVPDTLVFFTNGDSIMVQESMESIRQAVMEYQASILHASQQYRAPSADPSFNLSEQA